MTLTRSLVLALALAGSAGPLLTATVAVAADAPIPATGLLDIVPPAALRADGGPVDVAVLAWAPDGKGIAGLKLKPEASVGTAGNWRETAPGSYLFTWTPPPSGAASVTWTLKLKGAIDLHATATLAVAAVDPVLAVTSNPDQITLGTGAESTLSLLSGGTPTVRSSAGEVKALTAMGGGKHTAKYTAPGLPYPHLAIVTAADASNPTAQGSHVVIPLVGSVNFPVSGPANATVVLKVAGRDFGPVQLAADGTGAVPVNVPPGVSTATQVTQTNGQSTESALDLKVPETRRVALYPLPADVPGGTVVPVRAVVFTPDGKPNAAAKVTFSATRGTISAARHLANGLFIADWTPPAEGGPAKVTVNVDDSKVQTDELEVGILGTRPGRVALSTDPAEIGPATTSVKVTAKVTGVDGKPLAGRVVEFGGNVTLKGPVTDNKNGDYSATVGVTAATAARIGALPHAPVSRNPVRHVVVLADSRVPTDGASKARVTILATDGFGYPVANRKVELAVVGGDGKLSATSVTTDGDGIGRVDYTAGSKPSVVHIQATADGRVGSGSVAQIPGNAAVLAIPPNGGSAADIARTWALAAGNLVVPAKGGAAPVVAAPVAAAGLAAVGTKPTRLEVTVPASGAAGTTVQVVARPVDAAGQAIPGVTLDFLTSIGTLGPVTEKDGAYTATLTIPAGATGTAKVSIMHDSGISALGKIEVGGAVAAAPVAAPAPGGSPWGSPAAPAPATPATPAPAPAPGAAPAPAAPAPAPVATAPAVPKVPKEVSDNPWFRARASGVGGIYTYEQSPTPTPGELLDVPLLVGGPSGGRPASPIGFEVDGRVWVPSLTNLGFHAQLRETFYEVESETFANPAQDWLSDIRVDVNGRYPFAVGEDEFWIGAKAGFRYNDFMVFKGCLDEGCRPEGPGIEYEPLGVLGVGVGPELGVEIGKFHLITGYDLGLAGGSKPYSSAIDTNVGFAFVEHLFADLGFGWSSRQVVLTSADTGEDRGSLNDQQMTFDIGLGWEM